MIGSRCCVLSGTEGRLNNLISVFLAYAPFKSAAVLLIAAVAVTLTALISGFSCTGTLTMLLILLCTGAFYGLCSSHLILTGAANGLGLFSLTVLPAGVLFTTAVLLISSETASISKAFAANIFFRRKEDMNFRDFLVHILILFLVMIGAAIVKYAAEKLFSGLF